MTEADIFDSVPVAQPSRRQLRRQRRLAALYERGQISGPAFGISTIDSVRRMYRLRLAHGTTVHAVVFGIAALQALTEHTPGAHYDARQFGPIGQAVPWVHQFLLDGASKEALPANGIDRTIEWGEDCDRLLKIARRRYSPLSRGAVHLEQWLDDKRRTFPHITGGLVWGITTILAVVLGWLLKSWLPSK